METEKPWHNPRVKWLGEKVGSKISFSSAKQDFPSDNPFFLLYRPSTSCAIILRLLEECDSSCQRSNLSRTDVLTTLQLHQLHKTLLPPRQPFRPRLHNHLRSQLSKKKMVRFELVLYLSLLYSSFSCVPCTFWVISISLVHCNASSHLCFCISLILQSVY